MGTKALIIVEMEIASEDDERPTLISDSLKAVHAAGGQDALFHVLIGGPASQISDYLHKRVPR